MGPTSFNVGDGGEADGASGNWRALQWGRRLSTSETSEPIAERFGLVLLQWGRRLSTSETDEAARTENAMARLQWGRRLSTSETLRLCRHGILLSVASMGPTSFNVGDPPKVWSARQKSGLQWGRRLSTSETLLRKLRSIASFGFNGADVFQRRRPVRHQ